MAITGVHALLYTTEVDALRAVLRDALGWDAVDAGGGWLIFRLPPAELGVHPAEGDAAGAGGRHELSLMCDDLDQTVADLRAKGVEVRGEPQDQGFGVVVEVVLPGEVPILLYQPHHPTAI